MHGIELLFENFSFDGDVESNFVGDRMCSFFSVDSDDGSWFGKFDKGKIVSVSEGNVDEVTRRARIDKSFDLIHDSFDRSIPNGRVA